MQLLKNVFTAHKKWDLERNIPDWREWQLLLVKWTTRLLLLDSLSTPRRKSAGSLNR